MNNTADNLSATIGSGTVFEGKADKVRRINGLITLLEDMKTGIQIDADKEVIVADGYRTLREIRELVQEVAK